MELELTNGVLLALALLEVAVGIWQAFLAKKQASLAKKLKDSSAAELSEVKQGLQGMATKEELQQGLDERATKEEVRALKQGIEGTVQRSVPKVLQAMAEQYASQSTAGQREDSDVDSR